MRNGFALCFSQRTEFKGLRNEISTSKCAHYILGSRAELSNAFIQMTAISFCYNRGSPDYKIKVHSGDVTFFFS